MVQKKIMAISLLLLTMYTSNSLHTATASSTIDDLNKEMQKAGFTAPIVDLAENQPLLSKYHTNIQAFINANQEVISDASWIKKIPSLLGHTSRNEIHYDLFRAYNSLISVFDALDFKSPKSHFEDSKKSLEETKQNMNGKQSTITGLEDELKTLKLSLTTKDQKLEDSENSLKALIQMINPMIFSDSSTLSDVEKNHESIKSMQLINAYLKQNYPSFMPQP